MHHVLQRAYERYGITITLTDLVNLQEQIKGNEAVKLAVLPDGIERWLVKHQNTAIIVIYKPSAKRILTVLPRNSRMAPHLRDEDNE